jgi:hypothetical protein
MNDANGSWSKYEKLYLADRRRNDQEHAAFDVKLDTIISRLDKKEGEERAKLIFLNLGVPSLVAVAVTLLTILATM